MTEWIDKLAAQLSADEQRAAEQTKARLRSEQLVADQGAAYFESVRRTAETLVQELHEKLGPRAAGIAYRPSTDTLFRLVRKDAHPQVEVTVSLHLKQRQVIARFERKDGDLHAGEAREIVGQLQAGQNDRVVAVHGNQIMGPEFFASHVIQAAFEGVLKK